MGPISCRQWLVATCILAALAAAPRPAAAFSSERAGFAVRFGDDLCPYRIFGFYVLPEERLPIEVAPSPEAGSPALGGTFLILAEAGTLAQVDPLRWQWKAPRDPGLYHLAAIHPVTGESIVLNVFVVVPLDSVKAGILNGYRIGSYPRASFAAVRQWAGGISPRYAAPIGFIEVTAENEQTAVSPHFRLEQFLCKQDSGYPKYLVLQERLLLKLEKILADLNQSGIPVETFIVMSGYRTPFYNAAIGNVELSRHQWGDAADIYIDERPRDDVMDDLNHDGVYDMRDSRLLYERIDGMSRRADMIPLIGGIGWYDKTPSHGPFVHVDTRGRPAHWRG